MGRRFDNTKAGKIRLLPVTGAIFLLTAITAFGGEDNRGGDVSIPDGMEIIKKGDVNVLVPKGSRLTSAGSFMVKEDPEEYASRNFIDIEGRFNRMEKELDSLREELRSLRETVDGIKQEKKSPVNKTEDR